MRRRPFANAQGRDGPPLRGGRPLPWRGSFMVRGRRGASWRTALSCPVIRQRDRFSGHWQPPEALPESDELLVTLPRDDPSG